MSLNPVDNLQAWRLGLRISRGHMAVSAAAGALAQVPSPPGSDTVGPDHHRSVLHALMYADDAFRSRSECLQVLHGTAPSITASPFNVAYYQVNPPTGSKLDELRAAAVKEQQEIEALNDTIEQHLGSSPVPSKLYNVAGAFTAAPRSSEALAVLPEEWAAAGLAKDLLQPMFDAMSEERSLEEIALTQRSIEKRVERLLEQ